MTRSTKPVVIITGVSSGIGLEAAKLFSTRGWLVVGTVRSRKYPEELAAQAIDAQLAEMSRPADLKRVVERAVRTYGRVDCLVANAGYGLWGRLEALNYAQMADQLSVNVLAVAELARLVLPVMQKQHKGTIVAVSSVAGRVGLPEAPIYAASKYALEGLIESLWYDFTPKGILLRLVEPGPIDSAFWTNRRWGASIGRNQVTRLAASKAYPVGVAGRAGEVAEVIYRAATSSSSKLRFPVGKAVLATSAAKYLPEWLFGRVLSKYYDRVANNGGKA